MRILGIDPGMVTTGYGVIETDGNSVTPLDFGALNSPRHSSTGDCLRYLYEAIRKIIACYRPDSVAVEQPFVARNVRAALAVGRAQAVVLLAAASNSVPAYEYTPAQIKQQVANYGTSSKEQIQEMVKLQLGLAETPQPNDAADALAVALCHLQELHLTSLLTRRQNDSQP